MKGATALINPVSGKAVITEADGTILVMENERPGELQSADGVNLPMFLKQGTVGLETHDAGKRPYTEIAEYLELAPRCHRTLANYMRIFDSSYPVGLRQETVPLLEEDLADDKVYDWLKKAVLATPPPPEELEFKDLEMPVGRAGEIITAVIEKWRP